MIRKTLIAIGVLALLSTGMSGGLAAEEKIATLRGPEMQTLPVPPAMGKVENTDLRRGRAYPEQPPTIPHKIRDYQIDKRLNKCLTCHSRAATAESQAPMVSVTHFMDREGQFLASISPRRYFCNQCHVVQTDAKLLLKNDFQDVDSVLGNAKKN